ncbi:MAG TPA: PDZ domain-containing protein [Vicinamibacterales bacterium]
MDPIRYTLTFPAPHTHYVDIRAEIPSAGRDSVELSMAVWTPGSYLVREFSRHVEGVTAETTDGSALHVEKTAKNRWRVETPRLRSGQAAGAESVIVSYRVYGREMSVRTNWIESDFAFINGAATFLTQVDPSTSLGTSPSTARLHEVSIVPATGWMRSITALDPGARPHSYCAPDYDTLVDSPILVGNPELHEFAVDGIPHALANVGDTTFFDTPRAVQDLEAIVRAHKDFWGSLPYSRYVFMNLITEAGGGLEHARSSVLMTSRWATRTRKAYLRWLELASHELFHVWNVKRLRPIELGPFDYEREVFTPSLWMVEGITDYYGDVLVLRAGRSSPQEFLDSLSDKIEELQATPGRAVRALTQASMDAWIKLYRPDENTPNTAISYYTKGAVVAFLLDAKIRRATGGRRSLDEVMREAYARYSGTHGFTPHDFRALTERVAGIDLGTFWQTAIEGTEELDYSEALEVFGLQFRPASVTPNGKPKAWIGATTKIDAGRLLIAQVKRETPAYTAGLNVDDEIVAIDEVRVRSDRLDERLEQYSPGDRVSVLVARRDRLRSLDLVLGAEPPRTWRLEPRPA